MCPGGSDIRTEEDIFWSDFFIGYLYSGRVYFDIFKLMNPHYERALEYDFKERIAKERLIQHIAIGYLSDIVILRDESLLFKVIEKGKPDYFDILVRFFRSQFKDILKPDEPNSSNEKQSGIRDKIIEFWRYIYHIYKDKSEFSSDEKEILSHLLMLAIFLPKIDSEKFQWIQFSLSNQDKVYRDRFLIDDLNEIKEKDKSIESGRYIGKIFLEILNITTPTLFKDKIKSIVKFLYELGDNEAKDSAVKICCHYSEASVFDDKGDLFLRDLYDKFK